MKHKFSFYYDVIYPLLRLIIGKRYDCCAKLRNCTKCCKEHGYDDWMREKYE